MNPMGLNSYEPPVQQPDYRKPAAAAGVGLASTDNNPMGLTSPVALEKYEQPGTDVDPNADVSVQIDELAHQPELMAEGHYEQPGTGKPSHGAKTILTPWTIPRWRRRRAMRVGDEKMVPQR